jgi:hypothetical protein
MVGAGKMQIETSLVAAKRFTCEQCGSEYRFDAELGKLKCKHCEATMAVPTDHGMALERELAAGLKADAGGFGAGAKTKVAKCQDCGAQIVFSDNLTATECTFCCSSKVLPQVENRKLLRPESLLPFAVDKRKAAVAFTQWLRTRWLRPSSLSVMATMERISGVYVPFWTFDAHVDSSWTAEAGFNREREETVAEVENGETVRRTKRETYTEWESVSGSRADDYDDLLVCASGGLAGGLIEEFKEYPTHMLKPYVPEFLAGWRAEEYSIDLQSAFTKTRMKVEEQQRQRCAKDVPGDKHRDLVVANQYTKLTFKHILLPLWIAAYRYQNQVYQVLVNGYTGEVVGKAPWSWVKVTLCVLLVALLCGVGAYIYWMQSRASG